MRKQNDYPELLQGWKYISKLKSVKDVKRAVRLLKTSHQPEINFKDEEEAVSSRPKLAEWSEREDAGMRQQNSTHLYKVRNINLQTLFFKFSI